MTNTLRKIAGLASLASLIQCNEATKASSSVKIHVSLENSVLYYVFVFSGVKKVTVAPGSVNDSDCE